MPAYAQGGWGCCIVADFPPYWDTTITVLSKLSGKDSATKIDTWKKTALHGCFWKSVVQRAISGTSVDVGQSVVCRIPQTAGFKSYREWSQNIADGFAISPGDYIVRGEIAESIEAATVAAVVQKYRPDAFTVRAVSDNTRFGIIPHIRVEGV